TAVAPGFEDRSMELVSSAARDHDRVGGAIELGARSVGFDSIFLNGVQSGRPGLNVAGIPIVQWDTILIELHCRIAEAINSRLRGGAFETGDSDSQKGLYRPAVE